jgi:hypothetical protein
MSSHCGIKFGIKSSNFKNNLKMKKTLFLLFFGTVAFLATAQKSAIIVFSEDGEAFDLIVNGEKKSETPSTNVKVLNINEGNYRVVVKFQNTQIENVTQNVMVEPGLEYKFALMRNKKGKMVMRYFGDAPYNATAESKPQPTNEERVVVDKPTPVGGSLKVNETQGDRVSVSTTVTESTNVNPTAAGVTMNISADGTSMGVSMKIDGIDETAQSSSVSTTVTTSTTTSTSGGYVSGAASSGSNQGSTYIVAEESSSTGGCKGRSSMAQVNFQKALESIASKSFEDTKITTIKQIVKGNCITVSQLSEIIKLLTFEASKIEIAKFAYDYVSDTNNYFQVNDLFTFSSSVDELNEYLETK